MATVSLQMVSQMAMLTLYAISGFTFCDVVRSDTSEQCLLLFTWRDPSYEKLFQGAVVMG
jgi:hypothetical protein